MDNRTQNQNPTENADDTVFTLRIPVETVKLLNQYRKNRTIEEFMVKIITQDANRRKHDEEFWKAFNEWESPRIRQVTPTKNFTLDIVFEDGVQGEFNIKPSIQLGGGHSVLADFQVFQQVSIGKNGDVLVWPGGIELGATPIYLDLTRDKGLDW